MAADVADAEKAARKEAADKLPPIVPQWVYCNAYVTNYTRVQIWDYCFMGLGGRAQPGPGMLNAAKIDGFRSAHLYWYERMIAPSGATVVQRCDRDLPLDGWITRDEFMNSRNPACLGIQNEICSVMDVCVRELIAAGLPLGPAPAQTKTATETTEKA